MIALLDMARMDELTMRWLTPRTRGQQLPARGVDGWGVGGAGEVKYDGVDYSPYLRIKGANRKYILSTGSEQGDILRG